MAVTNAAATGSWTIQTRNNARQGRALLQTMFESVNSGGANPVPLTSMRSGVICTSDFGTDVFDLRVTVTSGLSMSVKPGSAVINRSGTGPYLGWLLPGAVTVTCDTAPASNPRNDLVVMRIYDSVQGDTVPGTGPCQIEVITGVPGAVPVDPPITGLVGGGVCLALARAQVSTGGVITLTDLRKSTSLLGGVRPMLPGDALGDGENLGGSLRWDPVNSNLDVWQGNGGVWKNIPVGAVGGEYRASALQSMATGPNKLNFGTTITAAAGITWNGSNQFTTLSAGVYTCSAMVYMPGGTGLNYAVYLGTSAATLFGPSGATFINGVFSPNGLTASASVTVSLGAGTTISAYVYNNQAAANTAFATLPAEFRVWRVR